MEKLSFTENGQQALDYILEQLSDLGITPTTAAIKCYRQVHNRIIEGRNFCEKACVEASKLIYFQEEGDAASIYYHIHRQMDCK